MQYKYTKYPALRILIIVVAIAIISDIAGLSSIQLILSAAIAILIAFISFIMKNRVIAFYMFASAAGLAISSSAAGLAHNMPDKVIPEMPAIVRGEVAEVLRREDKYIRIIVDGSVDARALPKLEGERIMLIITSLNKRNLNIEPGAVITAGAKVRPPSPKQLPTDFPERDYFRALDIQWFARSTAARTALIGRPSGFEQLVNSINRGIQSLNNKLYPAEIAGIVNALTTGDRTGIAQVTRDAFSKAGTAHLLAVSGLHTGIIAVFAFLIIRPLRRSWLRFLIFSIILGIFIFITGMQPSALRAGVMAMAFFIAREWQRRPEPVNVLAFSILILIAFDPALLYSTGFRMSAGAILGISILFRPFYDFWKKIFRANNKLTNYIAGSLAATFSASAIVTPLVAHYFGVFSIISPLANLVVVPLMSAGLIFSLVALLLAPVIMPIAGLYASAAGACISISLSINDLAASLPGAYLEGHGLTALAALISLGIIYIMTSQKFRQMAFRCAAAAILISLALPFFGSDSREVEIRPRQNYVAVILNNVDTTYAALFDRRPHAYPARDPGMEEYLANTDGPLLIATSGNASIAVADQIKYRRDVISAELSIEDFYYFKNILKMNKHIPQIIEYNYGRFPDY
ncbi:MAG: ComEC/Rec2 family competence protein [Candidatus Kapaibacterium sp.]